MHFGFAAYVAFPPLTQLNPQFWLNAICLSTQRMSADKFATSFVLKVAWLNSFDKIGRSFFLSIRRLLSVRRTWMHNSSDIRRK